MTAGRVGSILLAMGLSLPAAAAGDPASQEEKRLEISGHVRARFEKWRDFGFGVPAESDDTFALWRLVVSADFRASERVRVFFQGKSALAGARDLPGGERAIDADTLALQQASVDVTALAGGDRGLVFRVGRTALSFGKQRLVSPLPWGNTLRAWDGAEAIVRRGDWKTTAFWTRPVSVDRTDFNRSDDTGEFFGAYAARGGKAQTELYVLGRRSEGTVTFNGTSGQEDRWTVGGRWESPLGGGGTRLEIESAFQVGQVGSRDVRAWMATADARRTMASWRGEPRFGLVIDLASGDRRAGGDVGTFNQLFPLGHAYLGILDVVGRQNVVALSAPMAVRPAPRWTLAFTPYLLRRFEPEDALYSPGSGVVFPGSAGTSRDVGTELDLVLSYAVDGVLKADVGCGRLFAGEFVETAGGMEDIDFVYLQLVVHGGPRTP